MELIEVRRVSKEAIERQQLDHARMIGLSTGI
jgi:hypothetical protein